MLGVHESGDSMTAVPALSQPSELDLHLKYRQGVPFAAKAKIYTDGPQHLYGVIEGVVNTYTNDARRVGLGFYTRGDWFGIESLTGDRDERVVAYAVTPCVLMRWTPTEVADACQTPPGVMAINQVLVTRIRDLNARLLERQSPIKERVILMLLRLDRKIGQPGDGMAGIPRALPSVTQKVLSWEANCTRELMARDMNELRRRDAVQYSRRGICLWPERLTAILAEYRAERRGGDHA